MKEKEPTKYYIPKVPMLEVDGVCIYYEGDYESVCEGGRFTPPSGGYYTLRRVWADKYQRYEITSIVDLDYLADKIYAHLSDKE